MKHSFFNINYFDKSGDFIFLYWSLDTGLDTAPFWVLGVLDCKGDKVCLGECVEGFRFLVADGVRFLTLVAEEGTRLLSDWVGGTLTVLVFVWCVWYVTVLVVLPPACVVSFL